MKREKETRKEGMEEREKERRVKEGRKKGKKAGRIVGKIPLNTVQVGLMGPGLSFVFHVKGGFGLSVGTRWS